MVLIPPDAAIRMRMQTEANLLQPVQPVHEISSELPELRAGQTFNARIQETLPDNTYRALVAGKQLTLQLPEGAKTGDELELVVLDRSARVIIARQVDAKATTAETGNAAPYAYAKFSPAARLIGQLLPAEGEAAPAAQLNRGQPLLAQPPQGPNAAIVLAPTLAKAVTHSGVFYEAHQAQWVSGKLPLDQLLQEPQGQRSAPVAFRFAAAEIAARIINAIEQPVTREQVLQTLQQITATTSGKVPTEQLLLQLPQGQRSVPPVIQQAVTEIAERAITKSENPVTAQTVLQALQPGAAKAGIEGAPQFAPAPATTTAAAQQAVQLAAQVPDDLRPLVQQQLEAAAANRVFWHGEVWPRQAMDWEIEWDGEREADGRSDEEAHWRTALSLTTPRLGRIDASLQLSAKGVSIALATPGGTSAIDLREAGPELAAALAAAGVPLLGFNVRSEDEYPAKQG